MSYEVLLPKITAAAFNKNTVKVNESIIVTVTVIEEIVYLEAEPRYSGEFYVNEV